MQLPVLPSPGAPPAAMPAPLSPTDVRPAAALMKALADENRLRIVALLSGGELCVCHIAAALELSQPNASQHLTVLKNAGVVEGERRGSWIHYRLRRDEDPARDRILTAVLASVGGEVDRAKLDAALATVPCR